MRRWRARHALFGVIAAVVAASCGSTALPASTTGAENRPEPTEVADDALEPADAGGSTAAVDSPTIVDEVETAEDQIGPVIIDLEGPTAVFDRRILGTNLPAWLGPERLLDPDFQSNALATGTTLVRMPGGSWSNAYDWEACEIGDGDRCFWTWAAKPSHFAEFMSDTGLPGMWTVSINHTAQSAAATVAFFNGAVGDTTHIGVDRDGRDWATVDTWARLRAEAGLPEPVRIDLWEVGNEVYGGSKESGGSGCKEWGWEDVWTCDGTEYVTGNGDHDGYLAIRAAMLAVDPTIEIGAVGVPRPHEWNNWGNEVIEATTGALDFYVVHQYGFESSPGTVPALRRPTVIWPGVISDIRQSLGNTTPIAVTEYNLVSADTRDEERSMTQALNALYIAESIGQMSSLGVSIANQWNLANGTAANGTDYGMIDAHDGSRFPQFEALATWSRAGTRLLPVVSPAEGVNIYPTLHDDGRVTLIIIGRADTDTTWTIDLVGLDDSATATITVAAADHPTDSELSISESTIDLDDSTIDLTVPTWSISSVEIVPTTNS